MRLLDLSGPIGVEVLEADLAHVSGIGSGWSIEAIDGLREALRRRHLVLFRGQDLSPEAQVRFVGRFGPLVPERELCGYVSNVRDGGIVPEGALLFHSDFAFTAHPVQVIALHALELPADGSTTLFADAVRAAAMLPNELRDRLRDRRVLNVYDFDARNDRPMRLADAAAGSPTCEHPILGRHPLRGEEVVMANEMHSDSIMGVPPAESRALLDDLFAVLYDPSNIYEHQWHVGDLVLWDNVALHHGRRDIPVDEPRTLQRVTVGAYTPGELVPNLGELLAAR